MVTDPKVYVVEDDPGVCDCLRHLLGSVNIPVETYARAEHFLETQNGGRAGCVVADVCLPGMSGFDLQRALARRSIRLPIIMITGYGDVPAAVRAMKAGAIDFIEKPFSGQLLLDSIAYALKVDGQVRSAEAQREQLGERFARLTPRERQVMDLVVAGRTNRSIASEFGVSEKTVEIHRGQVMSKMQAGNLAELVRIAALLERPED
ncbi:MAG: response regulator transcription factor [Deltaproteobacteria bacterium]|nr:MAG: response regulator transcription factor [Deltaproteobacteria bacterium]